MFHYLNTSCPYANWVQTATKLCADPNRYHCLNNEIGQSGWICVDYILVESGRCLEFNSVAKKLDTIPCVGKYCPDTFFKSNDLHLYLGCRGDADEKTTSSNSLGLTTEASTLGSSEVIGITVGVIIAIAISIIAVAVFCLILRRRQGNKKSKNSEEGLAMLATPEPDDERSFSRAQRALRTERFVVITGIQGAGKTFLAKRLCNELFKEEKCVWITDPNIFTDFSDFESLFVLDDLFHELMSEDKVREIKEKIDSLYENVVVKGNGKIIITITSLILRRSKSLFEGRKYKNLINLDELSKVDREEILQFHMKLNNISSENLKYQYPSIVVGENDVQRMLNFNSRGSFDSLVEKGMGYPAAIALCCMINTDNPNDFNAICGRYVKSPVLWLRHNLKEMLHGKSVDGKTEVIVLSLLALHGGKLSFSNINTTILKKLLELENVKPAEEEFLEETLIKLKSKHVDENEGVYSFKVSVVMKFLFVNICEKHKELLQLCEKDLCERRVCQSSSFPSDLRGDYAKSFLIQKSNI